MVPFEIRASQLGSISTHTVCDLRHGVELEILTGHGGFINAYRRDMGRGKRNWLEGYFSEEDLRNRLDSSHCGARLLPFPNRLHDGKFQFNGVEYQLPCNFPVQGHAIHGLVFSLPWRCTLSQVKDSSALLQLEVQWEGKAGVYPWAFRAVSSFILHAGGAVTIWSEVENLSSSPMPLGEGWHPYFSLEGILDEWLLEMPQAHRLEVDDRGIPTGNLIADNTFAKAIPVGNRFLDGCFLMPKGDGRGEIMLRDPHNNLQFLLWQDTEHYRFVQFYSPPHRKSLAIEPMSCPANAFNSGTNLIVLAPGQTQTLQWGFELQTVGV